MLIAAVHVVSSTAEACYSFRILSCTGSMYVREWHHDIQLAAWSSSSCTWSPPMSHNSDIFHPPADDCRLYHTTSWACLPVGFFAAGPSMWNFLPDYLRHQMLAKKL